MQAAFYVAVGEHGVGLKMYRYAAPADDARRDCKVRGRDGETAHRADTAAKLKDSAALAA